MNLYLTYGKLLKYHKWKVLISVVLMMAASILLTIQIRYIEMMEVMRLEHIMTGETKVILYQQIQNSNQFEIMKLYLNGMAFSIMGISALGTLMLIRVVEEKSVRERILCAPIKNCELAASEALLPLLQLPVIWVIHTIAAGILIGSTLLSIQGLLMIMNILMLSVAGIGFAFLIPRVTKDVITMRVTLIAAIAIMCFISGGFIPDYLLGNTTKDFAVFTPVYWYIRANDLIRSFQLPEISSLVEIIRCFFMQLIFAVMFYVVAYADRKRKE